MAHATTPSRFLAAADTALDLLATSTPLRCWLVARRRGDRYVVIAVKDSTYGFIEAGIELAWDDTVCARMVAGLGPSAVAVVRDEPAYTDAPICDVLGRDGGYVGAPLTTDRAGVFGVLCGFDPQHALDDPTVSRLAANQAELLSAVLSAELELEASGARLEAAELDARTDALTGLGNRRAWEQAAEAVEEHCRTFGEQAAVVAFDVDGLKAVNDLAGHGAGDAVLRRVAGALRTATAVVAPGRAAPVLARVGGDEFLALLPGAGYDEAVDVARAVREALAADGVGVAVGTGVRSGSGSVLEARRLADESQYLDKGGRRSRPLRERAPLLGGVGGGNDGDGAIERLLDHARRHLGMDVAFVGEWVGDQRWFRYMSADAELRANLTGTSQPLADTVCQALVDDPELEAIIDASSEPRTASLPVVVAFGVGAHVGVPLRLGDGTLYGTLCCASFTADPTVNQRDASFLQGVATAVVEQIERERRATARRTRIVDALDAVLSRGGPSIVFQPLVDLASQRTVGFEALSRFGPELGVRADEWFAAAAEVGLDADLELAAIRQALAAATRLPASWLALNVSPAVIQHPSLPDLLSGADRPVVLELTEQSDRHVHPALLASLARLRAAGHRLAIDDAGAGHSDLRRIADVRPDLVKLDRSLVQGIATDPVRRAMVVALVHVAAELSADLVAEGTEDADDLAVLAEVGVDIGQGWFLGRPAPADEWTSPLLTRS